MVVDRKCCDNCGREKTQYVRTGPVGVRFYCSSLICRVHNALTPVKKAIRYVMTLASETTNPPESDGGSDRVRVSNPKYLLDFGIEELSICRPHQDEFLYIIEDALRDGTREMNNVSDSAEDDRSSLTLEEEQELLQDTRRNIQVAKEETNNYHAGLKLATARNNLDVLLSDSNDE